MLMLLVEQLFVLLAAHPGRGLLLLFLLALLLSAYFLPTIIALSRKHHQVWPVAIINFFLGWTFIGWVVALAIAVSHIPQEKRTF